MILLLDGDEDKIREAARAADKMVDSTDYPAKHEAMRVLRLLDEVILSIDKLKMGAANVPR